MSRLVVSWWGELGWELMSWQGYVRRIAPRFNEVIVCCPKGHEVFYRDFTQNFITHELQGRKDRWHLLDQDPLGPILKLKKELLRKGGTRLLPSKFIPPKDQRFISYGDASKTSHRFDVLIHARHRIGKQPFRAWDPENCDEVVKELLKSGLKVAAFGTQAYCPPGVHDLCHIPLSELLNIMAAAKLIVGPASGPIPLAALTKTPYLTWCRDEYKTCVRASDAERLQKTWNPLKTPCHVMTQFGFKPPAIEVVRNVEKMLKLCPR